MSTKRAELKRAVHTILNDVIEQCFRHLIHYPQHSDELNRVIKDATDEINYLVIKIDAHSFAPKSPEEESLFATISKDLHRKSLVLLSRLQKIQKEATSNVADE